LTERLLYIALAVMSCLPLTAQQTVRILSYNVENLFYPEDDPLHPDDEFTPEGQRRWTHSRYRRKLTHIAEVMANTGGWEMPAIAGFQEVEEARCLEDLCTYHLRSHRYRYVLYEGPDERGIDVGLVYDTAQVRLLTSRPIAVPMPEGERPTRDILYTAFALRDSTEVHVFTCHLPSQLGGAGASALRREAAYGVLRLQTDSLLQADPGANIVVMGDFNAAPAEHLPPLTNRMVPMAREGKGTEKYHGKWSCLDQIYVSPAMTGNTTARIFEGAFLLEKDGPYLGLRPRRTYQGFKYRRDGYSDHLPVVLEWKTTRK